MEVGGLLGLDIYKRGKFTLPNILASVATERMKTLLLQTDRLLALNLEDGSPVDNMQKLCAFAEISNDTKPVCKMLFPHARENSKHKSDVKKEVEASLIEVAIKGGLLTTLSPKSEQISRVTRETNLLKNIM